MNNIFIFFISLFSAFSLFSTEPVDIVYTWVDNTDENWQKLKNTFQARTSNSTTLGSDATTKQRFRDHNELRYSLRSIHAFAPWINHIYIVTCGQTPKWLAKHPKITIVDHKEIFLNRSNLPTFNSMAIECTLHRIPNLQEHYVYFNDDVFLGRNVSIRDFYTQDGKMKIFLSRRKISTEPPQEGETGYISSAKNTARFLNAYIGKEPRYYHSHTPFPSLKSVNQAIEKELPEIFSSVSSHKFRSLHDFTITNGIIPYLAIYHGRAERDYEEHKTLHWGADPETDRKKLEKLLNNQPTFFCIEDSSEEENEASQHLLQQFLNTYYPTPAPWENDQTN